MSGPSNHPNAAYPSWLGKVRCPLTVVVGPPGNGAAAWIAEQDAGEDLVLDIAAIIAELAGVPAHRAGPDWIIPALGQRNAALDELTRIPATATTWLVSGSPAAWMRQFWVDRGATVQLLDPGLEAALIGARDEGIAEKWVHRWYSEAAAGLVSGGTVVAGRAHIVGERPTESTVRPSAAKRGYGREHSVLRDEQLLREPWCRFCWEERQVRVRATVLDHIEPFRRPDGSFDGKLWGDKKNHRSCCAPCHDARGATRSRKEKPPGAAVSGRPLDPAHPWNRA